MDPRDDDLGRSAPPGGGPVVAGTSLAKRWGSTIVFDDATFSIGKGITGLLGSNGSGKTTLLGMLLGLHRPESGQLLVFGRDPQSAGPEIRARIGYSPEHHMLPPDMRAHDLVRHIAEIHGLPRRAATTRASDVLWQVGMAEERFRAIGTLSTGQRQRVKLAQALAHDPALLLLDEPTDGLDPVQRDDMLALIRRIGTEFGIDVLLSSHLLEEVERICDGVVILGDGKVIASGAIDALRGDSTAVSAELTTPAEAEAVAAQLRGVGWQVVVESSMVALDTAGDVDLALDALRDAVVAAGAGLVAVSPRRVSLEQIFLREVG